MKVNLGTIEVNEDQRRGVGLAYGLSEPPFGFPAKASRGLVKEFVIASGLEALTSYTLAWQAKKKAIGEFFDEDDWDDLT